MCRRTTFSVVFFCKKTKLNKKGKAPIYARITTSGHSTEIHTKCMVEPEHWNQRLERCMLRDAVSTQINEIIASYRANILAAYDSIIKEGRDADCFAIKQRLEHAVGSSRMFLAEFSKYCNKRQKEVGIRITQLTANKYHRLLRYMTEYTKEQYKKDDLPLDMISYEYIDGLNTFMQTAHQCRNNGAVNLLCCLKNFILYAIRNEWIEKNPFRYYRCKSITVEADRPVAVNLDGELLTLQKAAFAVAPEKIRFCVPQGLHWNSSVSQNQEKSGVYTR